MTTNNSINTRLLPTIYVSSTGSDTNGVGTISNPFASYEHARQFVLPTASALAPNTIGMIGAFNIVGDLTLSPFINVSGIGTGVSIVNVTGQVLLDASFGTTTEPITHVQNIVLNAAGNINLVFPAFQESTLHFDNVDFKDTVQFNATGSGTNVNCELVLIENCISIVTQPEFVFTNIKGAIVNSNVINTTSINNSTVTQNFFILTAPIANMGNTHVQTTSTGTMLAVLQGCFNPGSTVTIDGAGVQFLMDSASYGVLPVFLNGATFSQVQLVSLADGVAANNNFTPVNYTPTAAAAYKANSLTGNLKGIDDALAGIASGNVVLQNGSPIYGADVGATDAYAITLSPAPSSYVEGLTIRFKANTINTGGATLNVNGLGAIAILKFHDQALATGDIEPGQISTVIYDGTNFQLQSAVAIAPGGGTVTSVGITSTGGTVTITGSPVTGSGNINLEVPVSAPTVAPKNLIYNGSFLLWQRGASLTTAGTIYGPDRWQFSGSGLTTVIASQQPGPISGSFYMRIQRSPGNTAVSNMIAGTSLTRDMSIGAAGQPLTLTIKALRGANFSTASNILTIQVLTGTGTSDVSALTTGFTGQVNAGLFNQALTTVEQTFTFNVPAVGANITQLAVFFFALPVGTAGADDWFEIRDVQLAIGANVAGYQYVSIAEELNRCQYFYCKSYDPATSPGSVTPTGYRYLGWIGSTAQRTFTSIFPTVMRVAPTVVTYSPGTGAAGQIDYVGPGAVASFTTGAGQTSVGIGSNSGSSSTQITYHFTADAEIT